MLGWGAFSVTGACEFLKIELVYLSQSRQHAFFGFVKF
jgi:hypothetical protein